MKRRWQAGESERASNERKCTLYSVRLMLYGFRRQCERGRSVLRWWRWCVRFVSCSRLFFLSFKCFFASFVTPTHDAARDGACGGARRLFAS